MARKTKNVLIEAEGRDKGKVFRIVEMPASQAEKWATRALLSLSAGIDVPADMVDQGMAGVAALGIGHIISSIKFHDAASLMDEMFTACVGIFPDPAEQKIWRGPGGVGPLMEDDDIQEVATRLFLRKEILELHTNFSLPAIDWTSILTTAGQIRNSRGTPISPETSGS
jgi:hypothetical protein